MFCGVKVSQYLALRQDAAPQQFMLYFPARHRLVGTGCGNCQTTRYFVSTWHTSAIQVPQAARKVNCDAWQYVQLPTARAAGSVAA